MTFEQILQDIKDLKIQGAQNIAIAGIKSLLEFLDPNLEYEEIILVLFDAKKKLFSARETEPGLRNGINYVLNDIREECSDTEEVIDYVKDKVNEALLFFKEAEKKIIEYGAEKLKDGDEVYTHCHSSTVIKIILEAKKQGKNITVHNTETRPKFQGRVTAIDMAKAGIPVVHYVDSAARYALKKADIMIIGADAITSEGKVANKIGSELIAESAKLRGVPVYVCTHSWKFDPKTLFGKDEPIEERSTKEVWENAPKGIEIHNPAFEFVHPDLISGIICELGIIHPRSIVSEMKQNNKWMFEK